jgi:pyridoxamine 5'-phosphate oxidase family protein
MSVFTAAELQYLAGQRLGRLATVGADGAPHVVPVRYFYNAGDDTIDVGGRGMGRSKKWRDVEREPRVALVVDDVLGPGQPRMLEIRGVATRLAVGGGALMAGFDEQMLRIRPTRIVAYRIDPDEQRHDYRVAAGRDVTPAGPGRGGS